MLTLLASYAKLDVVALMLVASLIVMLMTQVALAALNLRGWGLRWGLQELFRRIDPKKLPTVASTADVLAARVLTHYLTSDSIFSSSPWIEKVVPSAWAARLKLASAIKPDELVGILRQLAADESSGVVATEINQLLDMPNPLVERQIKLMAGTSAELKALEPDIAPAFIGEAVKTIRESGGYLETCFKMIMDRVARQFATYVRIWTVVFSFAIAVVFGLDAVQMARNLYGPEGDFRAALVGSAPNLMAATDKILPSDAQSDREAVNNAMSGVYTDAVNRALADARIEVAAKPHRIQTRDAGETWIRQNVPAGAQQDAALQAYLKAVDQALGEFMKRRAAEAHEQQNILRAFGYPSFGWSEGFNWRQFFGVLLTGIVLSLAAPVWFNSLKALMNLRPIVASKQTDEDKASA